MENSSKGKKPASTTSENFWSKERVKRDLTIKEVAAVIEKKEKATGAYFTGFLIPDKDTAEAICDLFDVSYSKGFAEFKKAHEEYCKAHGTKVRYPDYILEDTKETIEVEKDADKVSPSTVNKIFREFYGKVEYKEFQALTNSLLGMKAEAPLMRIVYGKVPFELYRTIIDAAVTGIHQD